MSTTLDGKISINFATDSNGFNAGRNIVSAITKIENKQPLTQHEEYAVEVLWHEILHNKSKNTVLLPSIDSPLGFARTAMETVNQLVARHSYGDFIKKLGGEPLHTEWVINNGFGYSSTVANLRTLLSVAKIEEKSFIRAIEPKLMNDYADFDVKVGGVLKRLYKGKGDIARAFNMIEFKDFDQLLTNC
ncbi:MAG: hypothetical protein K1V80_04775 [Muribaculaceae bacterium]